MMVSEKLKMSGLITVGALTLSYICYSGYSDAQIKSERNHLRLPEKFRSYDENKDGLIDYKEARKLEEQLSELRSD